MAYWLTPDEPPARKFYTRKLLIPASSAWLGLVTGALMQLCEPWNYEVSGALTEQQTADYFLGLMQSFWLNDNEPPDWETPEDADGEPEQPWYDNLADWIIAGFLAVTWTPQAAIVYNATVPKLRIAIRTGNLGALFKVLINGVEVLSGDSYTPLIDLIDQVIDTSAYEKPYQVRIEHNGVGANITGPEAKLEVIRGQVVADMVATILREEPTGCGIQWSQDDGGTWNTIDLGGCIADIVGTGIDNAIADGLLQKADGQQGPESAPSIGECKTYHVKLQGNGIWHCPFPVNSGDSLSIANITGGWYDGFTAPFGFWNCGDGKRYALGTCEDDVLWQSGDPFEGGNHMQIIGACDGAYFNPLPNYTFPTGIVNQDFNLQANDANIADNQGSVEFDVTVCSGGWTHNFDFRASMSGWAPYYDTAHQSRATWMVGEGWTSDYYSTGAQIEYIVQNKSGRVKHIQFRLNTGMVGGRQLFQISNGPGGPTEVDEASPLATYEMDVDIGYSDQNDVFIGLDNWQAGVPYIVGLTFSGTGQDIFT